MGSTKHKDILQDKAKYLKEKLDSCLLASDNISEYINYVDERDQQNMLIMKYHIKEVSSFLDKIIISNNTTNLVLTEPVITNNIVDMLQVKIDEIQNWNDVTPDGSIIYEIGSSNKIRDSDHTKIQDSDLVGIIDDTDVYCEHDIILETDTHLDYINNDMFLKNVKNINKFKNIKFYMEMGIDGRPYLYIYKYKNDDTEYYIGDNNCIYTHTKDGELVSYDKYTTIHSEISQNNKKHNNAHDKRHGSKNVNKRNKNSKKKYADFVMMDYFIFRNIVDEDGFNNRDKYKDIQFCFVPDRYGCGSTPFLLYHVYLVGDNNRLYAIDNDTNNILDINSGQRFWRKAEPQPNQ
jgi:hypothetical protein